MQRFIRIHELATTPQHKGMLPVSPATVWRWVARKAFPAPVKLGPQVTAWRAEEVEAWLADKSAPKVSA